ncbi:MAG TPA: MBL fold metallo-hydrolase [Methanomicrobia archaeon]|nr:MBL fold metallo-hydrolase [Methanomicrobia archaeon]
MVEITVYGGAGEIGGNKILVEDQGTRLMLDFGTRMGFASAFFSEFLGVRSNTALKDKLTIGALPVIPGVYRRDLISPEGVEELTTNIYSRILSPDSELFRVPGLITYEDYYREHGRGYIDGILLTHAHMDHTGDIGFLHPTIPLYCSKNTQTLVDAIDDVTNFTSEAVRSKRSCVAFTKRGAVPESPRIDHKEELVRDCRTLEDGEVLTIGSFRVALIAVDHSVPGAASYVLTCDGAGKPLRILYTGDIRFHGTKGTTIDDYVSAIGSGVDIMICEGTRIDSDSQLTEERVCSKITEEIAGTDGLVFVEFSWKDTTRYETISKAAVSCGRTFVINARLAYVLNKLELTPLPEHVSVFLKRKGSCFYSPNDYSTYKHEYGYSVDKETWTADASHYNNGLVAEEIKSNPRKYVVMLSYYDLGQLFDLADAAGKIPGSRYIRAQCEPFSDEMELDEERLINWLDAFGIGYRLGATPLPVGCTNPSCSKLRKRIERSHVSGHASRPELQELISKVNPRIVIPVHTERPEAFKDLVTALRKEIWVIIPELGETYRF